jgi:hypothetical protein
VNGSSLHKNAYPIQKAHATTGFLRDLQGGIADLRKMLNTTDQLLTQNRALFGL